jgi:hypothetical protein
MLQRYGLPTAAVRHSTAVQQPPPPSSSSLSHTSQTPVSAQYFIQNFLGGSDRSNASLSLPLSGDMLKPNGSGGWSAGLSNGEDGFQVNTSAPLKEDSYYDVHPTHSADGERLPSLQSGGHGAIRPQDMSAASFITLLSESLAGKNANVERFYPFCVWLTCDGLPSYSASPVFPV